MTENWKGDYISDVKSGGEFGRFRNKLINQRLCSTLLEHARRSEGFKGRGRQRATKCLPKSHTRMSAAWSQRT